MTRSASVAIQVRRVYDDPSPETDGCRVLVDRLWPRGLSFADAALDEWLKDVAPSADLRRWYDHDCHATRSSPGAIEKSYGSRRRPRLSSVCDGSLERGR